MAGSEQLADSNAAAWPLAMSLSALPVALPSRKRKSRIAAATLDEESTTVRHDDVEPTRRQVKRSRRQIGPCHSPSVSSDSTTLHTPPQQQSSSSAAEDEQLTTLPTSSSSYFQLAAVAAAQAEVFHHRFLLWHILDYLPLGSVVQLSLTCKYFLQCLNLVPGSLYSVHQLLQQFRPYLAHRSIVELSSDMTAQYMLHHQKKLIDFNDFVAAFVGCRILHVSLPVASADASNVDECGRMGRRLLLGLAQMTNNKLQHLTIENLALPDRFANTATSCYGVAPRLCASLESLTISHSSIASHHWHQLLAVQVVDPLLSSTNAEQAAYKHSWPHLTRIALEHCAQLMDTHLSWITPANCPSLQHFAVPFAKMLSGKTVQRVCQQYNSQLRSVNLRGVSVASSVLQQSVSHTDRLTDLHLGDLYHAMDEPLMKVLTEQCNSTLTRLAVGSSGVKFQRLADRCHNLKVLDVNCCMWFDDESLETVCKANQQLQSITMANCWRISNGGLERLARLTQAVPDSTAGSRMLQSLRTVNLYSCSVGDTGMRALASIPSVTSIDCGNCSTISDAGIQELAALTQLQHLSLENNIQISGSALPHVARGTPLMHSVSLARCSMLDEDSLLAALTFWDRIKWLDVSGCIKLTHKVLQYIQYVLPECKLVHTIPPTTAEHCDDVPASSIASTSQHAPELSIQPTATATAPSSAECDPIAQHWAKRRRTTTGPPANSSPANTASHTSHSRRSSRRSTGGSRAHSLRMTSLLNDTEKIATSMHHPLTPLPLLEPASAHPLFLSVPQLTALMDPPPLAASSAAVTVSPSIIRRIELPSAAPATVQIAFTRGGHPTV